MMHVRCETFLRFLRGATIAGIAPAIVAGTHGVGAQQPVVGVGVVTAPGNVHANDVWDRRVTVTLDSVSLKRAVKAIAASAGIDIQYQSLVLDAVRRPVTLRASQLPLGVALEQALQGTGLKAIAVTADVVNIAPRYVALNRSAGRIIGVISDAATKQPIHGATLTLDGATKGVLSGIDGTYQFPSVSAGAHTVAVKYIGYHREVRQVLIADGGAVTLDVALSAAANQLDQVVVTGTVIPTELKAVPSAITVITAKELQQRGITQLQQLFRGDVPGLFAQNAGSFSPLDSVVMFSRGATQFEVGGAATNTIKTYVDGIELANPSYLSQIDPKSIERIEILTGPQASTIYGSNALNGVMQIFTKRGSTSRPQVTAALQSGIVQNNFSAALTPQHDYSAQVSGIEARMSYNAGASWLYVGPWTPAKQTSTLGFFGGVHAQFGPLTADGSIRGTNTQNIQHGAMDQLSGIMRADGTLSPSPSGYSAPTTYTLHGQTLGATFGYTPTSWWSHELVLGSDVSNHDMRATDARHAAPYDTLLSIEMDYNTRTSYRYATTVRVPVTRLSQLTMTAGADGWHNLVASTSGAPTKLTGGLTSGYWSITNLPSHNAGAFLQTQLALVDALFVTYGLRAEWNPNYGADAQPNLAPRYGIAYTREIGPVTAKLRGSYGRSTRPPQPDQKAASIVDFTSSGYTATVLRTAANPDLAPEYQQGGEGGLELYLGNRGSLVITRYNQTVDNLIANPQIDSTKSLTTSPGGWDSRDAAGYGYLYVYQYMNIGSIRNQGWEFEGTVNTGPLSTKGTYSWTKSRVIGVSPTYQAVLATSLYATAFQKGRPFSYMPEHTWALTTSYGHAESAMSLTLHGVGRIYLESDDVYRHTVAGMRLSQDRWRMGMPAIYRSMGPSYVMADFNASKRLTSSVEGLLQVQNLTDYYHSDIRYSYAVMGRQTKAGFRIRL